MWTSLQKQILYSWKQKSPLWTRKLSPKYLHSNKVDIRNAFWDLSKYMMNSCPSWKSREHPTPTPQKNRNFLISTSNYQRYTKCTSIHMFWGWQKGRNILKKITNHPSCQNPRWPPIMVKDLFLVWNKLICPSWYCLNCIKTNRF